ncbi:MAG: response regulator [Vicinamibacterales bacterium]
MRLLSLLHVRVPLEVDVDGRDAARGRSDRPVRGAPDSYVARVEMGPDGRARGVSYFDARKRLQLQRAKAVVLCANGAETPRLLLNSSSSRFPNGLANSSGVVGTHLMFNTYYGVNAQFEHPLNEHKSVQNTRIVLDFYESDPKRGFYGGGGIDARFGKYPITFALGGLPPGSPTWGEGYARRLAEQYTRSMFFGCHGTSLPVEANSVSLDPTLKDAWGLPAMRVTYKDHADDPEERRVPREPCTRPGRRRRRDEVLARPHRTADQLGAPARHVPDGERPADVGRRPEQPYARCEESVHLRRQQPRHVDARPADDDDHGARLQGGRTRSPPSPNAARSDLTHTCGACLKAGRPTRVPYARPRQRADSSGIVHSVTGRLLLIDDDVELASLLAELLGQEAFVVDVHGRGEGAAAKATSGEYALVILDVMLPNMSGFEVLKQIRQQSTVPVILLTARGDDIDRIVGLELGADDYIPKPFNPRELIARIRAVLRRADTRATAPAPVPLRVDDVVLDPASRTVVRGGTRVELTSIEFDLLRALLESAGQTVDRETLAANVLGRQFDPFDRSIDMHVSKLRRKLGDRTSGEERIKTVRGTGYIYTRPAQL